MKFVACGKNEVLDSDMNYDLGRIEEGKDVGDKRAYEYLEPV